MRLGAAYKIVALLRWRLRDFFIGLLGRGLAHVAAAPLTWLHACSSPLQMPMINEAFFALMEVRCGLVVMCG